MKLFFLLILTCLFGCSPPQSEQEPTANEMLTPSYPWEECKNQLLSHACNFTGTSTGGIEELYQYYQRPIVIEFSAMWCGYCQVAGAEADAIQDLYSEHGLIYLTVLIEDFAGMPPSVEDVQAWKDNLDVKEAPVWAASRDLLDPDPALGWELTGWPTFYFVDKDMIVQGMLRGYSPQALSEGIIFITKDDTGDE